MTSAITGIDRELTKVRGKINEFEESLRILRHREAQLEQARSVLEAESEPKITASTPARRRRRRTDFPRLNKGAFIQLCHDEEVSPQEVAEWLGLTDEELLYALPIVGGRNNEPCVLAIAQRFGVPVVDIATRWVKDEVNPDWHKPTADMYLGIASRAAIIDWSKEANMSVGMVGARLHISPHEWKAFWKHEVDGTFVMIERLALVLHVQPGTLQTMVWRKVPEGMTRWNANPSARMRFVPTTFHQVVTNEAYVAPHRWWDYGDWALLLGCTAEEIAAFVDGTAEPTEEMARRMYYTIPRVRNADPLFVEVPK